MSNINLYQAESENTNAIKKKSILSGSFYVSIFMFVVVVAGAGAARFISEDFSEKKDILTDELKKENENFSKGGADIERVFDFNTRVNVAAASVKLKPNEANIYSTIEARLIPSVRAEEINYTNKEGNVQAELILKTQKFEDVARQIKSFKESEELSGVILEDISKEEKIITFNLILNFQKKESKEDKK